ncbi:hypothetical protein [Massilia rubra]|uniref:HNH domain-containing protein n=1 Tax=Massilia rubra TaxID=2607910 RepID=A0ABX0LRD7_9BURK|nr:hypothetical protein [Massilia rubra]NHZ34462.1 hypothetical protein [Massilia rubra]
MTFVTTSSAKPHSICSLCLRQVLFVNSASGVDALGHGTPCFAAGFPTSEKGGRKNLPMSTLLPHYFWATTMTFSGKLPGKTAYSGIRRPTTRSAGVTSHGTSTGGQWDERQSKQYSLVAGVELCFQFEIPPHVQGQWIAFGGWFLATGDVDVTIDSPFPKFTLSPPRAPDWSKMGSMWQGSGAACVATLAVKARSNTTFTVWNFACGIVRNPGCFSGSGFVECDGGSYLQRMHDLSPEAHLWEQEGAVSLHLSQDTALDLSDGEPITVKSCNRCGRFLPVNFQNERATLSFSNHCVANRPCKHPLFGAPRHIKTGEAIQLEYGFQLECRYCKKYCVNWMHNRQRTAAQMKEDGARRRFFELLIAELFQESKQLAYKEKNGRELADYIWNKFEKKCFSCGDDLPRVNDMHLDHTRPLALLWPLDETATALCGPCNSSKSDKFPSDFYEKPALEILSKITGIPLVELETPAPNMVVVNELIANLEWFFSEFLTCEVMTKERDGKVAAELVVKALQKTLDRCPSGAPIDLRAEYERRLSNQR